MRAAAARLLRRLIYLARRRHLDAELREEIETHRILRQLRLQEDGLPAATAEAASRVAMGNTLLARDGSRDVWLGSFTEVVQDIRFGCRVLRRSPLVAVVVVSTMTVAIGMNVAMFAVADAVWLRPLPFPDASRLAWVTNHDPRTGRDTQVSRADVDLWRGRVRQFVDFAAYGEQEATVSSGVDIARESVVAISPGLWSMMGAHPAAGMLFDGHRADVGVVSTRFAERLGQGQSPVGRTVVVNSHPYEISGVLPPGFRLELPGVSDADPVLYVPLPLTPGRPGFPDEVVAGRPTPPWVSVIGRLRPEATLEGARAELDLVYRAIAREYPSPFRDRTLRVASLRDKLVGDVTTPLTALLVGVVLILLVAVANLLHVLVAHAGSRRNELQTRLAIGASRLRLARQLITESLIVAALGTMGGLATATGLIAVVVRTWPDALPRLADASLSWPLVSIAVGLGTASAVILGTAPGLALLGSAPIATGRTTASRTVTRARDLLVSTQLAVATLLLIVAGLAVKSFWVMGPGGATTDPAALLVMRVSLTGERYRVRMAQEQYVDEVLRTLRDHPAVASAGIDAGSFTVPASIRVAGAADADPVTVVFRPVSDGFLRAVGVRLLRGHWPRPGTLDSSGLDGTDALIVNRRFAQQVLGSSRDPIGIRVTGPFVDGTIAGVVEDVKDWQLDADPPPQVYVPFKRAQVLRSIRIIAHPRDPGAVATVIDVIRRVDRSQALGPVMTLEQVLEASVARRRLLLWLVSAFAITAVLLALTGAYGIVTHGVAQRRREIGVRLALGAAPSTVVWTLLRHAARLAVGGVLVGMVLAFILSPMLDAFVYGVPTRDPWTFAMVAGALMVAAAVACWRAAARAGRVNPLVVLQS